MRVRWLLISPLMGRSTIVVINMPWQSSFGPLRGFNWSKRVVAAFGGGASGDVLRNSSLRVSRMTIHHSASGTAQGELAGNQGRHHQEARAESHENRLEAGGQCAGVFSAHRSRLCTTREYIRPLARDAGRAKATCIIRLHSNTMRGFSPRQERRAPLTLAKPMTARFPGPDPSACRSHSRSCTGRIARSLPSAPADASTLLVPPS